MMYKRKYSNHLSNAASTKRGTLESYLKITLIAVDGNLLCIDKWVVMEYEFRYHCPISMIEEGNLKLQVLASKLLQDSVKQLNLRISNEDKFGLSFPLV